MYGEQQEVSYYCTELLWGQKLYQELRFVLVQYKGSKSILVSTDLTLSPKRIIELYAYRFSIEELFREFKQQMYYARKNIFSLLLQHPDSFITRFIRERQKEYGGSSREEAA